MPPDGSSFTPLNLPSTFSLPQCMEYFSFTAGPNTNLWRKPPTGDIATAPIVFTSLRNSFVVAEVTVSADMEMEWDQGGLVIFTGATPESLSLSSPAGRRTTSAMRPRLEPARTCKWVKAGIEFCSGAVHASSVSATADGADWCLAPLDLPDGATTPALHSLRIKLERIGHSLWIWYQVPSVSPYARTPGAVSGTWKKLREVTWFFYGVDDKFVHVGVYASRPNNSPNDTAWFGSGLGRSSDGLVVEFEDLEIF
ncbi:uncharacterized protein EURHEDRAFT_522206 [Aspergillus ruber CBS 135680]|uniref:Concanavalin A-like lectin/glucanase domain-containing protein n=1 Tax=Aspergillus ruber (strain CBS 135680) TaxID=1388766 RepID=A0A017SHR5_ASPRC|nr:uncharacterized protein EURHEDRAFT_522206 [Aspergillus ruber CBS 135680]EYE96483.1 hypothetical protein EURHEDRAFT_522206 [Aspergillus ruber CBS 135680]